MTKYLHHLFCKASVLLFFLLLFSCREEVQMDFPDFDPVPVLNGILTVGDPVVVHVSLAGKFENTPLPTITDAVVELWVNNEFVEVLTHKNDGFYSSDVLVTTETLYTCKLTIPGHDPVSAATLIPAPAEIVNLEHINFAGKDRDGVTFPAINLTFANDTLQERYYEIRIILFDNDHEREITFLTQKIIDPVLLNEGLPLMVFSNSIITTQQYGMHINYSTPYTEYPDPGSTGGRTKLFPLLVELRSVPRDYYLFARQNYLYKESLFPDYSLNAHQVFPLHTNVENGYGLFTGYSSNRTEKIHPSY